MKKIYLLFIILLTLFLTSCSAFKTYEDTNGEDDI